MGSPDSQYPVENSTETEQCCGYRTGYITSEGRLHEGRKAALLKMHKSVVCWFVFCNIKVIICFVVCQLIVKKTFGDIFHDTVVVIHEFRPA